MPSLVACVCAECALRFPGEAAVPCPLCNAETKPDGHYQQHTFSGTSNPVDLNAILDNVRSVFNVGSMFRTADAVGMRKIYLGGISPTPAHPRMAKTSLGAENTIEWESHKDATLIVEQLKTAGREIWALESTSDSISVFDVPQPRGPVTLIVGNEVAGVDPSLLGTSDLRINIPMSGAKTSLNVATAFGIATYAICERIRINQK